MTTGLIQEIILTRSIHAAPADIYGAFTTAAGWCAWCSETAEVDARVGGKLHIYTEGYHSSGEFMTLEPERLIVFTWNGDREPPVVIEVRLAAQGDLTEVIFKVTGQGSEQEWVNLSAFFERIWGHVLDHLKDVMENSKPEE
ncbi:MAG TPA: SRPBCC domain-containing protein [Anaerolineaceae bacterium]|nr:SRPBCC domain-containing protein [Anaerolineaceae bacterium]HPN51012.1 SRPBCC domain-containing protein [Anaerolineaceae bacterium]